MKKIKFILIMIFLCLLLNNSFAVNYDINEKLIAVILPFSSAFKGIAVEQQNAINLFLEENNKYQIVYKDSKSDAIGAVEAFNELLKMEKPPFAVISCASWVASALHPLAAKEGIFHIVIASANFQRSIPHHTIRFTIDGSQEEKQLANYLTNFNNIAIYYMNNSYGIGWQKNIKDNLGNKVGKEISYDPMKKDFIQDLEIIAETTPDALVLLSASKAAIIAKEAREMGIEAQFVGTRPIERPELLKEAEFTNGLVYTYPTYDQANPMLKKYKARYGMEPTIFGVEAYESIKCLVAASEDTDKSAEKLFNWFANKVITGALGEVHFDENGDAHYPYMYKQIVNGEFVTAEFQYKLLLQSAKQEIDNTFSIMDSAVKQSAKNLSKSGIIGDEVTKELESLFKKTEFAYDVVTVDKSGIIRSVYPSEYSNIIGSNIMNQPQIIKLHKTQKPVVSEAIETVEGFTGFDLEYPVFDDEKKFIGSVSVLTQPDFFEKVISQKISNFPVEIWIMQKDGTIVYDVNDEEIGLNIFEDEIYAPYKSLKEVAKNMAVEPSGEGKYFFLDTKMNETKLKKLIWTTISLHGTEFRLALSHISNDL
ncbi:MAG: ABC transporter substrate-binding protein [Candidatus Cloacimonetes bacterium]|nr:ABC transporter substrate-binding protein [Candidatus Cloacimonadota bacterium]MCF7814112.1 ABC transporter substrate-binding protein [Candidatus Cloacimonadota bacterium]MCF7867959.1 ABC transporter substrate-binding protein [Candidatus Cloacimonadota bacterium]MCF7883417.1 ABC transporter substrate-binding protein [Candidatus Cloacimonadota bacterium]